MIHDHSIEHFDLRKYAFNLCKSARNPCAGNISVNQEKTEK